MEFTGRILKFIDSKEEDIVSFMQKIIQIPSVTGEEAEIGSFMAKECRKDELEVEIVEPKEGRVNVVANYQGNGKGPKLMMYSHYDVVPAGDLDSWKYPPFGGEIHDGWLWGRGAQDNKIATCALTMAYRCIKELGIKLKGEIVFTHVGDEEVGGLHGFQEVLKRGYGENVDMLFYAHGGSAETIGIAANGSRGASFNVKGKSAHTAQLENGVNAVINAAKLVLELQELGDEVNQRTYKLPGTDSVMRSRFSVNKIHGYVAHNNVPDRCEVEVDRRYTPGETEEKIDEEYSNVILNAKRKNPELSVDYTILQGNLVSVAPADSLLVKEIQKAAKQVIGILPKPIGGSHSSDHGWFVRRHRKPFASYGIGGEGIHGANERIRVEDIMSTTKVYALSMLGILGVEE